MVGTVEEAVARLKEEDLTDFDRTLLGEFTCKNLRIPLESAVNLRRVADIMHGLATELDRLSRRGDMSARSILIETQWLINRANRKIRTLPGKGTYRKPHDDPLPDVNPDSIHRKNTIRRRTKVAKIRAQESVVE